MSRRINDDDDLLDNILADNQRLRIPMTMMDAANDAKRRKTVQRDPRGREVYSFESESEGDDCNDRATTDAIVRRRLQPRDSAAFRRPARGYFVTDSAGGTLNLHKPGFRIETAARRDEQAVLAELEDELGRLYKQCDSETMRAYQGDPSRGDVTSTPRQDRRDAARPCPDCEGSGEDDNDEDCKRCGGSGELDNNAVSNKRDQRSIDQIAQDHATRMQSVYAAYDMALSQQYRGNR